MATLQSPPSLRLPRSVSWTRFAPDGMQLFAGGDDPHLWAWRAEDFSLASRTDLGHGALSDAALHPSFDRLAVAGSDGTLGIWDLASDAPLLRTKRHDGPVSHVRFLDGGAVLVSVGADGALRYTDATTGKRIGTQVRQKGPTHGLATDLHGDRVGVVHRDGARVWDRDGAEIFRFEGLHDHGGAGQSDLAFARSGRELWMSLRRAPELRAWSLDTGQPLFELVLSGPAFALAFSADERTLAVALHGELVLIDVARRAVIDQWAAPNGSASYRGAVCALSWSPDGQRLASGDVTGGVWVWQPSPR